MLIKGRAQRLARSIKIYRNINCPRAILSIITVYKIIKINLTVRIEPLYHYEWLVKNVVGARARNVYICNSHEVLGHGIGIAGNLQWKNKQLWIGIATISACMCSAAYGSLALTFQRLAISIDDLEFQKYCSISRISYINRYIE